MSELHPQTTDDRGQEVQAKAAFDIEQRIKRSVRAMRGLWVRLAEDLYRFQEAEMWRDLGHTTFEQWLASPDIELRRRWVYELIGMWRDLVITRGVEPRALEPVNVSKVREVLPAIRRGEVSVGAALADCESLGRDDLRTKYTGVASPQPGRPDVGTGVHTASEPEFAICHACGSRYQIRSAA